MVDTGALRALVRKDVRVRLSLAVHFREAKNRELGTKNREKNLYAIQIS